MFSAIVFAGLFGSVCYAFARNWTRHVPQGSSLWRRLGVVAGYALLALFCLAGILGALASNARD